MSGRVHVPGDKLPWAIRYENFRAAYFAKYGMHEEKREAERLADLYFQLLQVEDA